MPILHLHSLFAEYEANLEDAIVSDTSGYYQRMLVVLIQVSICTRKEESLYHSRQESLYLNYITNGSFSVSVLGYFSVDMLLTPCNYKGAAFFNDILNITFQ